MDESTLASDKIMESSDVEALDTSINESVLRRNVDPVTLGMRIKMRLAKGDISLSQYAKKIGRAKSVLSEWIRMTDLTPEMQIEVKAGTVPFRHALNVARLDLPPETEIALARIAREDGTKAFKNTLNRLLSDREKGGIPTGLQVIRINWGTDSREYSALKQFADSEGILISEYCHRVLTQHIQSQMGWITHARRF